MPWKPKKGVSRRKEWLTLGNEIDDNEVEIRKKDLKSKFDSRVVVSRAKDTEDKNEWTRLNECAANSTKKSFYKSQETRTTQS